MRTNFFWVVIAPHGQHTLLQHIHSLMGAQNAYIHVSRFRQLTQLQIRGHEAM
jgi:hypothetical protein